MRLYSGTLSSSQQIPSAYMQNKLASMTAGLHMQQQIVNRTSNAAAGNTAVVLGVEGRGATTAGGSSLPAAAAASLRATLAISVHSGQ